LFPRLFRLLALMRDPRVAKLPRFAVIGAFLYLLWPVDLIPDFVAPVVGLLDDLTLGWLALRWLARNAPPAEAPGSFAPEPPRQP
jgi:uncharacterized membrane protein YkvA (DUF1232 family)